jgi:hypothetical protein
MLLSGTTPQPSVAKQLLLPDQLHPPALVLCETEATCDRDPAHLVTFARGFLNWYIAVENGFLQLPWAEKPTKKQNRDLARFSDNRERLMQQFLTGRFLKWRDTVNFEMDYTNHDFCAPGTDTILCAQDWADGQFQTAPIIPSSIDINEVELFVSVNAEYHIVVRLRPERGAWRVDGVRRTDG